MKDTQLYNISIIKTYIDYIEKYYPDVDIASLLDYAGITKYELEDKGYWFSQEQADRFHEIVVQKTGNPDIARDAGRFSITSISNDMIIQYIAGFVTPSAVCAAAEKINPKFTRGATLTATRLGTNKVEIISKPVEGVEEKPYQCENRVGLLESLAKPFTGKLAIIEHPECIHKGDKHCRYILTWGKTPSFIWRRAGHYLILIGLLTSGLLSFYLPNTYLLSLIILFLLMILGISGYSAYLGKTEFTKNLETQRDTAELLLQETNKRYNDAILIREIGTAASKILDIDELLKSVMHTLEKWLAFDRGAVLLANSDKTHLVYTVGYGYNADQEKILRETKFNLDDRNLRGVFVDTFKKQSPYLVDDIADITNDLSEKSLETIGLAGTHSFICVPIIFEEEPLGVLSVDNMSSKKSPFNQSDSSLLMSIAQQIAIAINNVISFQKLQANKEKYRDLVENANSIIMRIDTHGRVTFFNKFAQNFFGYTEEEIIDKDVIGTIISENNQLVSKFRRMLKRIDKHPYRYSDIQGENMLRNKEKVWISWTSKPILNNEGHVIEILWIGNDITERKKAAEQREKLEIQLSRARKMEAIGALAGGVAHDLNNILTGIVGYPDLLLMQIPKDSSLKKPLLTIKQSGEKAAAIVQDLLTLARRGVGISEVINLNTIISDYLNSPEHKKLIDDYPDVQLEINLEPDLPNILGSPVHLSKTIMNLTLNAAEAITEGGTVSISTKKRYIDTPIAAYDNVEKGNYVVLSVIDTGKGIPSDKLTRIFEPFYTTKVMGKSGTGLGLAVVWGTVKDHNGYIDARSEEGKGTRFDLYLPVTTKESAKKDTAVSTDDYMGSETILVVDDMAEQRDIACEILKKLGYAVTAVSSGEKAVEYMKNNSVDLLVLDMIMNHDGIDGLETYKRVLNLHPGQKAIIVSGYSQTDRVKEAQRLGAGAYVKKPYALKTLGMAVRSELDR